MWIDYRRLFPKLAPTDHRVPLLEIVEATGVPLRSRGRGAPIEVGELPDVVLAPNQTRRARTGMPDPNVPRGRRRGARCDRAAEGILSETSPTPPIRVVSPPTPGWHSSANRRLTATGAGNSAATTWRSTWR